MNNSFARLIDGMCATLRTEVLTRLEDDFARGQVFGVINLLNTFKARADWSSEFLSAQLKVQSDALAAVHDVLKTLPSAPNSSAVNAPESISAADMMDMRDANNQCIDEILTWVDEGRASLDEGIIHQIEHTLRQALKREIELELKYSPRPLFAEMSSGKEY